MFFSNGLEKRAWGGGEHAGVYSLAAEGVKKSDLGLNSQCPELLMKTKIIKRLPFAPLHYSVRRI